MKGIAETEKKKSDNNYGLGFDPIDVDPLISEHLYKLENEKIFKKTWLKVARVEEVSEIGGFKVKKLDFANTSAIIVRGKDNQIRAFHNICTHRGNKVIPEEGNETFGKAKANVMTCRFHGWVFDTDGSVRSVPKEEEFESFDKGCYGLKEINCDVWEGFVFINLDQNPSQTLREYLGGMADHFSGYKYGESTYAFTYRTVLNCNWKVALYAFTEGYHVETIHAGTLPGLAQTIVHKDFKLFGPHSTSAVYSKRREGAGIEPTPVTAKLGGMLKESPIHGPKLDELPKSINPEKSDDFQFEFPTIFPNLVKHVCAGFSYPGLSYFTHQFWPMGVGKTVWEGTNYFHKPKNAAEAVAIAHVNALHRNAWLEDTGTMEDTFEAASSGVLDRMPLMTEELMIRNTHAHWHQYVTESE